MATVLLLATISGLIKVEFIRGEQNLRSQHHGCVLSVGNYDGLHLGHQQVIKSLVALGRELSLPVAIISFEPHPLEFFVPESAPPRLMSARDKFETMQSLKVDRFCCLRFNHQLANTEPEAFVENLLIEKLGMRHIVVGDDFRFGRNRRGNFQMLQAIGREHGIEVARTQTLEVDGQRVSSTRIRKALACGNIETANRLLGREFAMSGRVVRGDGNAKIWGFATANIQPAVTKPAVSGVFVVLADLPDGSCWPAVASLGTRPTVGGSSQLLEVHLLDFDGGLYGQRLRIRFLKKLRDETKFSSVEKMCEQIELDIVRTREFFREQQQRFAS